MKCYTAWLRDYLPAGYDASPEYIADRLTASCAVAEGISDPFEHLDVVTTAVLREAEAIEGSKKLYRCVVETRDGEERVVCGAPNTPKAVGRLVAYAPPGARLPFFTVGEREIMGVVSRGVLCSELELGLSADHGGILLLESEEWKAGATLVNMRPQRGEAVIEFETTPNRPDTLSQLGLARQLAADYLLVVTVRDYGLRPKGSRSLYHGHIIADAELFDGAKAKADSRVFWSPEISTDYPKGHRPLGQIEGGLPKMREELDRRFAATLVKKFRYHKVKNE